MEKVILRIKYDGEGLADNFIDVKSLTVSLFALSEIIEEANKVINGEDAEKIEILASANVEQNCFELIIGIICATAATIQIIQAIFGTESLTGIFGLGKRHKGEAISKASIKAKPDGTIKIEAESGEGIEKTTDAILEMYNDVENRRKMACLVNPLTKNGCDNLMISLNDESKITFDKKEAIKLFKNNISDDEQLFLVTGHDKERLFKESNRITELGEEVNARLKKVTTLEEELKSKQLEIKTKEMRAPSQPMMKAANLAKEAENKTEYRENEIVTIELPGGKRAWEFNYNEKVISAKIEDGKWLESYKAGHVDARPTRQLNVDICLKYGRGKPKYIITKVNDIIS